MQSLFKKLGGTYTRQGDYFLPNVKLQPQDDEPIGVWGELRKIYLMHNHRVIYYSMLTQETLRSHLISINKQAEKMEEQLTEQFKQQERITEALKASDMMVWVRAMNNITNKVREIILSDLICR